MGRRDNETHRGQGRGGAALRRARFQDTAGQLGEFKDCGGERASKVGKAAQAADTGWSWQAPFGQQTPSLSDSSRLLFSAIVLFVFAFCVTLGKSGKSDQKSTLRASMSAGLEGQGPPGHW